MAITWAIEFVKTGDDNISLKERLARDNNVKDLEGKITDLDKTTSRNETEATINEGLEDDFDNFVTKNEATIRSFFLEKKYDGAGKEWIQTNFRAFLDTPESQTHIYLEQIKNAEISQVILGTTIELNNLSDAIQLYFLKNDINTWGSWHSYAWEAGNVFPNDKEKTTKWEKTNSSNVETKTEDKKENTYNGQEDYLSPYPDLPYATLTKEHQIENIYKDNKLAKVMKNIFNNEEGEELRRWTFRVDLGVEHGLAGIVVALREAIANKNNTDKDNVHKKLYDVLIEKSILHQNGNAIKLNFSRKDLKELIKDGSLRYERKWWLDNEINKVANILSRAQREDLDTFASLLQSKSDIAMAIKEWNNAKEMTGNDGEHPGESSLITTDNVLGFLCDFNSDAEISAAYKRKNNKEQKNQWDVGTLFGQQVMWTIEQAIAVKNVELSVPKGEHLVIQNIIKNMQISDSRSLSHVHLQTMKDDPSTCTKENLAKLINGDEKNPDEAKRIPALPEMKIFFLDAIKKINGWSTMVQPDLYATLVGKDAESLVALYESKEAETELKNKLAEILTKSEDPTTKEAIRRHGLVRVRETLFTSIMHALDNVEITTNDGTQTKILAAGVSKWREVNALKKELLEETIKNLILSWIHYTAEWWLILTIGYGREWQSKTYRTKRNRWANGGVILTWGKVEIIVTLSAGIAEQYNYKKVINADLSQVKSAKYLGIEWWVLAGIGLANKGIEAEAYAGINRQQDPEAGINQIDKQYRAVSEEIFDLTGASSNILSDKTAFTGYIMNHIDALASDDLYGRFVTSNREHLKNNLAFMVRYMEANKFFGTDGLFNKLSTTPWIDSTNMANTLVDILQSGNIEQRRHDVIAWLHGKISLTKLWFGITTNALTLKVWASWPASWEVPPVPWHTGVDGSPTGTAPEIEQDRFWIFGLYVGARISTWRNMYVPNVAQYLFTQYEAGQGIGMESVNFADKNLDTYGKYLVALYHDIPQKRLSYQVSEGKLILRFDPQGSDLTLAKFLNIHATTQAQVTFSLQGNVLTIGDVGEIASYTISEGTGVRRILCLGTKKLDEASRVTGDIWTTNIAPISFEAAGNIPRTKEKITTDIISQMSSDGDNTNIESVKTQTLAFFDAQGKLQTPPDCSVVFDPAIINNTSLTNGTLTIKKTADKNFIVSLDTSTSADQLKISYLDETLSTTTIETVKSYEVINLFTFDGMLRAQRDLTQLASSLEELENNDKVAYADFIKATSDAEDNDGEIDDEELAKAIVLFENLISKSKYPASFDSLIWFLHGENEGVKAYIVDRLKQILAREPNYKNMTIGGILISHSTWWEKVVWPSKSPFPADLLKEIKGQRAVFEKKYATTKYSTDPVIDSNLIGYTAFYRPLAKRYSITALGETSYQWEMMPIIEHKDLAKSWFMENFKKNTYELALFAQSLASKFAEQWRTVNLQNNSTAIESLINWDSITIDSWEKISIDLKWMFYLLGDCCNESLGMKIENIKIQGFKKTNEYAAIWTPDTEYTWGVNLYAKNDSITSEVLTQEEKAGIRYGQEAKLPGKNTPPWPWNPTIVDPTGGPGKPNATWIWW